MATMPAAGRSLFFLAIALGTFATRLDAQTAAAHHERGVEQHLRRQLDDASREYARALALEPPVEPTARQAAIVTRFAPRLHLVASEPFGLKDVAAIVHPTLRIVAYHLFWDDDIDFPEDNDPCDHEVMWVQYGADERTLERVWTYFHGRILEADAAALDDARRHQMRPRVDVQWGKHGSMPAGWQTMTIRVLPGDAERPLPGKAEDVTLAQYNQDTFRRLSGDGRRLAGHPLARRLGWPTRFAGSAADFVAFTKVIDPVDRLGRAGLVKVSRWNSATINQHLLAYNFRPKTEWPVESTATAETPRGASIADASTLDTFQLPPKTAFDKAMPRYPNVWFYVDAALAPSYRAAVDLVTTHVRERLRGIESHGPFSNPEGCDFEIGLEHLQPWEPRDRALRPLMHAHAFHMRYYFSALEGAALERVTLTTATGPRAFYRVAASAHYEVEHANPHHADVEACPICGRTGEYSSLAGNLVEQVHDPLGVELLLTGTIRGEAVRFEDYDRRPVAGILAPSDRFALEHRLFPGNTGDRNTLRLGVVVVRPPSHE
jgi:hypothetical protein